MIRSVRALRAPTLAVAALLAGGAAAERLLLASPAEPGPNVPRAGRSAFAELFDLEPGGPAAGLPFPFERLVETLTRRIAPAAPTGVLVPLGRSLQRHAADRDYFAAPRVVVSVTDDPAAGPERPFLADRLFLGFHAEAHVIEVISFNDDAGRFEFEVVEDYGPGLTPRLERGERFVCTACHQGHGPIFADALWSETGANPRVAARLAALGPTYAGVPTRPGVDRSDAVDRSTDRAARLVFADFVWRSVCGEPACRGDLLLTALRFRLGGARAAGTLTAKEQALADRLAARIAGLAPDGVAVPAPDLPNRDPVREIEAGVAPHEAVAPDGAAEPTLPHPSLVFWQPDDSSAALFVQIVPDLAASFSTADIGRLDALIGMRSVSGRVTGLPACQVEETVGELRFACGAALDGYLRADGTGAVRRLQVAGHAPVQRLRVEGGRRDGPTAVLPLREAAEGLTARLASGERLGPLRLQLDGRNGAVAETMVTDDLGPLRAAVASMVARAEADPGAALGPGPLRRRAVLAELDAALGGSAEGSG